MSRSPRMSRGSALPAKERERAPHLAEQAERLLVDQEEIRPEHAGRVLDDGGPERERLLDVEVEIHARVLAVPALDDSGHADEVDAGAEAEAAQDGRAAQDEDVQLLVMGDERVGDRPAAAEVPQPERVVAVDQDAVLRLVNGARPPRPLAVGRRSPTPDRTASHIALPGVPGRRYPPRRGLGSAWVTLRASPEAGHAGAQAGHVYQKPMEKGSQSGAPLPTGPEGLGMSPAAAVSTGPALASDRPGMVSDTLRWAPHCWRFKACGRPSTSTKGSFGR